MTKSTQPLVSVIIPAYNAEDYIDEAVSSILNQTYRNLEIIIINDNSTDRTYEYLSSIKDNRVRLINNTTNLGCTKSLNIGINNSNGIYIARMDADDISINTRIEKQISYMESNPDIGVCGTWVETFGEKNELWKYPTDINTLKCKLLFSCELAHPSTIYRKDILEKHNIRYDSNMSYAQDYDLWQKLVKHTDLCNIPEPLLKYRLHTKNISRTNANEKKLTLIDIHRNFLKEIGIVAQLENLELHEKLARSRFDNTEDFIKKADHWLNTLCRANNQTSTFPKRDFNTMLYEKWYKICLQMPTRVSSIKALASSDLFKSRYLINRVIDLIQITIKH